MRFGTILTLSQEKLYSTLRKMFKNDAIAKTGSYILVKGEAPIMLLAHLDTVHKENVKQICSSPDGMILMSPQGIGGDDRCGVYALITAYDQADKKPWLLFTCDEEIGGIGAGLFCHDYREGKLPKELSDLKCLIEIDRKGKDDAVYYDCANGDFEDYITSKGFKTEWGSFSDISVVAPELGVAAVNLSSGYYNAHTLHEYIDRRQLNDTIRRVSEIVAEVVDADFPKYEYIESMYLGKYGYGSYEHYAGLDTSYGAKKKEDFDSIAEWVMYNELLDWYTPMELDIMMQEYGNNDAIRLIYESEFGYEFDDDVAEEDGGDTDGRKEAVGKF